jgi:Uma2 family endonuclease
MRDVSTVREIILPETTPETEWILDRPVQKIMPTTDHSILQLAFAMALKAWAANTGTVGTEWRFRAAPPGEEIRPVVPDVAYMSFGRLRSLSPQERRTPPIAPEIVVEILSPDDRQKDVDEKRRVYFAWGITLEVIADPQTRTVDFYDSAEHFERVDASVETYSPAVVRSLAFPLRAIFAELDIPEQPLP